MQKNAFINAQQEWKRERERKIDIYLGIELYASKNTNKRSGDKI